MATDSGDLRHGPPNWILSPQMRRGLTLLRRAWEDTPREGHKTWNPAVPIRELRAAGLTDLDFVWLLDTGYVLLHAATTDPPKHDALAGPDGTSRFAEAACFLLTELGLILTQFATTDELERGADFTAACATPPGLLAIPDW